jgi:hypothetical protein
MKIMVFPSLVLRCSATFGLAVFALIVLSCTKPPAVPPKLVRVYSSILRARNSIADSATLETTIETIRRTNGYTKETLRAELLSMSNNKDLFMAFQDSVQAQLKQR